MRAKIVKFKFLYIKWSACFYYKIWFQFSFKICNLKDNPTILCWEIAKNSRNHLASLINRSIIKISQKSKIGSGLWVPYDLHINAPRRSLIKFFPLLTDYELNIHLMVFSNGPDDFHNFNWNCTYDYWANQYVQRANNNI